MRPSLSTGDHDGNVDQSSGNTLQLMNNQKTYTNTGEQSGLPDTACSTFVQRFAYRPHPNPKIRKMLPDELQVGWEFEELATGEKRFVHWGSTKNRQTLARLIDDVKEKHGILEVVSLSS